MVVISFLLLFAYALVELPPDLIAQENKKLNNDLWKAAREGKTEKLLALIQSGANVRAKDKNGKSALFLAAEKGHRQAVEVLIRAGSPLDAQDEDGNTALMQAARKGHAEMARDLIQSGADPNIRTRTDGPRSRRQPGAAIWKSPALSSKQALR